MILPVSVVQLQLHELHLRMIRQQLVQFLCRRVGGEPKMLELAGLLLLERPVPQIVSVEVPGAPLACVVDQVEIEVLKPRPLQGLIQKLQRFVALFAGDPACVFAGNVETVPRVPLDQRLANRPFRAFVRPGRVKVVEPGVHEQIHHLLRLFNIDFLAVFRQAHQAETQLADCFIDHIISPIYSLVPRLLQAMRPPLRVRSPVCSDRKTSSRTRDSLPVRKPVRISRIRGSR